jgi:hypothetical protein
LKGWFIIHLNQKMLDLNYTSEMEKAMHQSHGMGYAEYAQNHKKRMDVEVSREADYRKSQLIYADIQRKLKK